MRGPVTIHEDTLLRVFTQDLLLAVRWLHVPQFESLKTFRELQSAHLRRYAATKSIIVSYSNATGELHFDSGTRELVAGLVTDAKTHLLGMAQVVVGDGFGAASVRAVLSGVQLAARPDYPLKVFSDTASAQPWLEDLLNAAQRPDLARDLGTVLLPQLEASGSSTD